MEGQILGLGLGVGRAAWGRKTPVLDLEDGVWLGVEEQAGIQSGRCSRVEEQRLGGHG